MLKIERLTKKFDQLVFDQAEMQVATGTGALLAGRNGAGKSTLLKIMAGVIEPDTGSVFFEGRPLASQRQLIGYCPATSAGLYRRLSVRQNLHYFGSLYQLDRAQIDDQLRANNLFEIDYWDKPVDQLSDGMLQKVKLVRALLHKPRVLLLDEPFNYLDVQAREALLSWLRDSQATWVIAQHSTELVDAVNWQICQHRLEKAAPA